MDQPLPALEAELARTAFYPPLFTAAFGDASITSDRSARALAQFVRSMISAHSTFDLALAGDRRGESVLSAQEQLGRDLFEGRRAGGGASLQCSQCHRTAVQVTGNAGGHGGPNGRGSTMNIGLDRTPTGCGRRIGRGRSRSPDADKAEASLLAPGFFQAGAWIFSEDLRPAKVQSEMTGTRGHTVLLTSYANSVSSGCGASASPRAWIMLDTLTNGARGVSLPGNRRALAELAKLRMSQSSIHKQLLETEVEVHRILKSLRPKLPGSHELTSRSARRLAAVRTESAMSRILKLALAVLVAVFAPFMVSAQINFPKTNYLLGMGDSWAAGEGALPVTSGYVYRLYDHGVFGPKQQTDFANIGMRGARTWELLQHQVPQALCTEPAQRPRVVTITSGGNDFLEGDFNVPAIAARVVQAIHLLLNNDDPAYVPAPVIDPVRLAPCRALSNVTILVGNYLRIPHPEPLIAAQLDAALVGYDQALRFLLATQLHVPDGSRVVVVDTYTPSVGRDNLVTISRRLGYSGPFNFDFHPTNYGHAFIAQQFAEAWNGLQ